MEQEPVYVPAGRLQRVCEAVLARIYDLRQRDKEAYVGDRVQAYNQGAIKSNKWRTKLGFLGVKPKSYITPYGMELEIRDEIEHMPVENRPDHPMCVIHRQYGNLEHETKDAIIQCQMNESVLVSADMARGISHLGLPLDFMQKPKFGFQPAR